MILPALFFLISQCALPLKRIAAFKKSLVWQMAVSLRNPKKLFILQPIFQYNTASFLGKRYGESAISITLGVIVKIYECV